MEKFRHNKKQNSAFLYEVLILELTKAILKKNEVQKNTLRNFIKESFNSRSALYAELKLYNALVKSQDLHPYTAEKILTETKKQHTLIDPKQLLKEQASVVRYINKNLDSSAFNNFVPNYKSLATIYQIFNKKTSPKSQVLLENKVIASMIKVTNSSLEDKMVPVDNLVYKSFVKRFNSRYSAELLPEQKELLSRFIGSFGDNGVALKVYLNTEVGRLKSKLKESLNIEEFINDTDMRLKAQTVTTQLENFNQQSLSPSLIEKVIKIQSLVNEISN